MGAFNGPLGLAGGAGGSGFAAPQGVEAPQTLQPSMQQQQQLLTALQGQNGLQNQNQVYGQLQGIINGTGPNPAQAALNQNTAANVAQTGALMAGQRGAGANVGLMARQAGQQGAATQQQGVGQAATLQAQQAQNAITSAGNMANTQAQNQIGQTNAVQNANQALYNSNIGMQSNINQGNTALALQEMQQGESAVGGFLNGMGGAMGSMGGGAGAAAAAKGGMVVKYADGGDTVAPTGAGSGPQSEFGQYLQTVQVGGGYVSPNSVMQSGGSKPASQKPQQQNNKGTPAPGGANTTQGMPGGDVMPTSLGGNVGVPTTLASNSVDPGAGGLGGSINARGGNVAAKNPSQKAVKSGDSYSNDKIPAVLSEGEIVLPRSITKSPDAPAKAASFVAAQLAKRRGRK